MEMKKEQLTEKKEIKEEINETDKTVKIAEKAENTEKGLDDNPTSKEKVEKAVTKEKKEAPYKYKKSKEFEESLKNMGTLERLAHVRLEVNEYLDSKSGLNEEDGFNYFELKDFMPIVNNIFLKYRIIGIFGFPDEKQSKLDIKNFDDKEDTIVFTMNRVKVNSFNNQMQAEGAINTYSKRYLYMNALELCDKDIFDAQCNKKDTSHKRNATNSNKNSNVPPLTPLATKNQKKYINEVVNQLARSGLSSTKTKVKALMKFEGFSSLSEVVTTNYSYDKAEEIIHKINDLKDADNKEKRNIEETKKREEALKTQEIQNDFSAGDVVEPPEGEVVISEANIGEMEF